MRVSDYYKLERSQPSLPFVDVDIHNDVKLFANARAIRSLGNEWGDRCEHLLSSFFDAVVGSIRSGDDESALNILSQLKEPNETHLGLSRGKSDGRGLGPKKARQIWQSFRESKAVKTGLLSDLEDTVLLIDGVSVDILSDIITNIIREPLIAFTQRMCGEYEIPMADEVSSGPLWDPETKSWKSGYVRLPMSEHDKLILVPKSIVRLEMDYNVEQYYRHYVLERLKTEEKESNSELVSIIKTGRNKGEKKVYKTDLQEKYGTESKAVSIKQTDIYPELLKKYKDEHAGLTPALSHKEIADVEGTPLPDWDALLSAVTSLTPGKPDAYRYEAAITNLLIALFHPVLVDPDVQTPVHNAMKRVDLTFTNNARIGFFEWLGRHYSSPYVFVECKNFGDEVGNPEVDQLAMRMKRDRGQFGILICRKIENRQLLTSRCIAAANDGHGYILALDDDDLGEITKEASKLWPQDYQFPILQKAFKDLVFNNATPAAKKAKGR